ncbi:MAG: hypothetical protein ACOX3T_04635 [Bdellovibrionota bacterium]
MKGWSNSEIPSHNQYLPEKKLLSAVLQRAITDFISGEGDLRETAKLWILGQDPETPLTFEFICEALDLDTDSLKRAIISQGEKDCSDLCSLKEMAI